MPKCPCCGKDISEKVALFQSICDDCIEILTEIKERQDEEMQQMFEA